MKIEQEIALTKARIEALDSKLDHNYSINKRSLAILSKKNRDSLYLLESTLGTLGANPTTNLSVPIIEEFFEKGLLSKVENDSIKVLLQSFKIMSSSLNSYDEYLDAQYVNSIEPYFYEHINYSQVTGSRRRYLLSGGPKTDFQQFYDNLELWNLVTFKIESIEVHQDRLKSFLKVLEKLNQELAKV